MATGNLISVTFSQVSTTFKLEQMLATLKVTRSPAVEVLKFLKFKTKVVTRSKYLVKDSKIGMDHGVSFTLTENNEITKFKKTATGNLIFVIFNLANTMFR